MTFGTILQKLTKRWPIIVLVTVIFGLSTFGWISEKYTVTSITVGANLNSPELIAVKDGAQSYALLAQQLSNYLSSRFASITIQSSISKEMGVEQSNYSEKKPFYEVSGEGLGFVSLTYRNLQASTADKFNQAVKNVYNDLITKEWNNQRQTSFMIQPMNNFLESKTVEDRPIQSQILPVIAGIILGLAIVIFIPLKKSESIQ